jgi:hypothetical protein
MGIPAVTGPCFQLLAREMILQKANHSKCKQDLLHFMYKALQGRELITMSYDDLFEITHLIF